MLKTFLIACSAIGVTSTIDSLPDLKLASYWECMYASCVCGTKKSLGTGGLNVCVQLVYCIYLGFFRFFFIKIDNDIFIGMMGARSCLHIYISSIHIYTMIRLNNYKVCKIAWLLTQSLTFGILGFRAVVCLCVFSNKLWDLMRTGVFIMWHQNLFRSYVLMWANT